jgi:branched-chain amino acid transport system substrate-binding protein
MILSRRAGLILGLALLGFAGGAAAAETPIKIGFHGVLTGPNSVDGLNSQVAINLALKKWNDAGGINGHPIEIEMLDDQAKPDVAVPAINKLTGDDSILAIISATLSEPTKAAAPFAQDAQIPYISAWASSPDVTRIGDYIFRIGLLAPIEGKAAADFIAKDLKLKKVALVTVKSDLGKEVARGFKAVAGGLGLDIVGDLEFSVSDRQFGPMIANLQTLNPDIVFETGYYFHGGIVPQIRAAGLNTPVIGMTSNSAQQFLDIAGAAANGTYTLNTIDWSHPSPELSKFLADFKAKTGFSPTSSAAHAYVAADVLFQAIKNAPTMSREAIRDSLAEGTYDTIVGPVSFGTLHETRRVVYVSKIVDGKYTTAAVIDDPVLLAPPEK